MLITFIGGKETGILYIDVPKREVNINGSVYELRTFGNLFWFYKSVDITEDDAIRLLEHTIHADVMAKEVRYMKNYYIYAGNNKQAWEYCRKEGIKNPKILSSMNKVHGLVDIEVQLVGTWWERNDVEKFREYCDFNRIKTRHI